MKLKFLKFCLYGLWIAIVVFLALIFIFKPEYFSPENIYRVLIEYRAYVWVLYSLVSFVRGFFMLPSTPFILSGVLLFPNQPLTVLLVSMGGVLFSASLLYYFSDSIGFSKVLERKYPNMLDNVNEKLSGSRSFLFIFTWSIFPFVPTDLICYVSGIIKLNYWKLIFGVLLGEGLLNSLYVYGGVELVNFLTSLWG